MRYSYVAESHAAHEAYDPFAVTREPFPAPVATSRRASCLFATPRAVLALAEFAREHSWEVRTQYSRGHLPHGTTGEPSVLKDLIGLRFGAHPITDRQAYAVYMRPVSGGSWTWGSVMIWGPDLSPYAGCGVTELKDYLSRPDADTTSTQAWIAELKTYRAQQDAARKARPKAPARPKEGRG